MLGTARMAIDFVKLHGCGNDYIAIDGRALDRDWNSLAAEMSKPAFGVGSDGIILLLDSKVAQTRMRVFNPDGSEAEMSGNGIRLFAKFVLDYAHASPIDGALTVETMGGIRTVWPTMRHSKMEAAKVAMGPAIFNAAEIPVNTATIGGCKEVIDQVVDIDGHRLSLTCLAIGNPHAVTVIDTPVEEFPLAGIGALVEKNPIFPQRINFEVVNIISTSQIRARIFERGAGETLSSGTGSTASAFACRKLGMINDNVDVILDGGTLNISWNEMEEAFLQGPAVEVFTGTWND